MKKMLALSAVFLIFSCSSRKQVPSDIIKPDKMQLVFWDYIRADAFTKDYLRRGTAQNDTLENLRMQNRIFSYYHISRDDFYKSYQYYIGHPELMGTIMDSIIARQTRKKKGLEIKKT